VVFTSLAFAEPWFSLRSISRWTHGPDFVGQCGESVDFTPLARFCGEAAEFHRSIFGETAESLRSVTQDFQLHISVTVSIIVMEDIGLTSIWRRRENSASGHNAK
jgi:hypothetical protein